MPTSPEEETVEIQPILALPAPSDVPNAPVSSIYQGISSYSYKNYNYEPKSSTGYAGLSNQGATCYLNSLLQILFMTPEFRYLLYQWKYDPNLHGPETTCIPLQLQKLFARLQCTEMRAVKTNDLTTSFGWDRSDSFVQHDIQELCRVLFEALDKFLDIGLYRQRITDSNTPFGISEFLQRGTVTQNVLISDLYSATVTDYIRSITATNNKGESVGREREDIFMDLNLVISNANSVEEALDQYITPEILNGDNQWFSEELQQKVDVYKGLKIKTLPYILTLHLKRFDFDYSTFQRVKLDKKVTFPFLLDMSHYVNQPTHTVDYELFGVCIHSGTANGGHYYAYVKDLDTNLWLNFNDSSVTQITESQVMEMYGGTNENSAYRTSSTNAYMLMYRFKNSKLNLHHVSKDAIPQELKTELEVENAQFLKEKLEYEEKMSNISITVHWNRDTKKVISMVCKKNVTMRQVTELVLEKLKQREEEHFENVTMDCIRLREFKMIQQNQTYNPGKIYSLDMKLEDARPYIYEAEIRHSVTEEWPLPKQTTLFFLFKLNKEKKGFEQIVSVRVDSEFTVYKLREFLAKTYSEHSNPILPENVYIAKATADGFDMISFESNDKNISDVGLKEQTILHYELVSLNEESLLAQYLDSDMHSINVYFNTLESKDCSKYVFVDKRRKLKELKELIAVELNIDPSKFRLSDKLRRTIFKNEQDLIQDHLIEGSQVLIEEGAPILQGQVQIALYLLEPSNEEEEAAQVVKQQQTSQDTEEPKVKKVRVEEPEDVHMVDGQDVVPPPPPPPPPMIGPMPMTINSKKKDMQPLGKLVIEEETLLVDLKQKLANKFKTTVEYIRVRVRTGMILSHPLVKNQKSIKENVSELNDGKQFVIQVLKEPEQLEEGDVIIMVQQWKPSEWKLEKQVEIILNQNRCKTLQEVKQVIANKYQLPLNTNIGIAKAPLGFKNWTSKCCADTALLPFTQTVSNIWGMSFRLQQDDLLLWKLLDEPEKVPLEELKKEISSSVTNKPTRALEKSLKIFTIYDAQQQQHSSQHGTSSPMEEK